MIVLGFDTATNATALALAHGGETIELRDDPSAGAHPGHATRLLGMADEALRQAGLEWGALDRVAVGVGPGTFTGLRVGIATARGLAHSLGIETAPVSSLLALAHGALDAGAPEPGEGVLAVIDARRGEVFVAAFEPAGEGGRLSQMLDARPVVPEKLDELLAQAGRSDGWVAVGDGALRHRERLARPGLRIPPAGERAHLLSARAICELGAQSPAVALDALLPDYRRRPDAELALRGAAGGAPA